MVDTSEQENPGQICEIFDVRIFILKNVKKKMYR
jgi:hypothetical protein